MSRDADRPDEFEQHIKTETAQWSTVVREAGIKID